MIRTSLGFVVAATALVIAPLRAYSTPLPENVTVVPFFDPAEVPLEKPVWFGEMPGKPGTYLVLERMGVVTLVSPAGKPDGGSAKWIRSEFLKIAVNGEGEMGLLGIAFHPGFADNRKYYLNYIPRSIPWATLIEERMADSSFSKDSGKPPRQVMRIVQTRHGNHKGGTIAFGPKDGFLYVGMGDGGESILAQDRSSLLGKMLRVDVNVPDSFRVPLDNPFVDEAGTRPEIWALGLRNPWKWSFDPTTGELWAGDVGETAREEINLVAKGANLGWPFREGTVCLEPDSCSRPGLANPVMELGRAHSTTIIGGMVFRGNVASPFNGAYFFADFELRTLWAMRPEAGKPLMFQRLLTLPDRPSSFGMDSQGNLFVTGYDQGIIYRLESPDLKGMGIGVRRGIGLGPGREAGGFLRARRGRPLDLAAWRPFMSAALYTPDGRSAQSFGSQAGSPRLDLPAGRYFLKVLQSSYAPVLPVWVE
ncbi:MAG: PQQ-dependent sugar dehydrogenase [Fibrobacterota bacterium]|nr:PQQ-dependent sugar dehydrogenase [Fibrobacterota bacterium]